MVLAGDAAQASDHRGVSEAGGHKPTARHLFHDAPAPRHDAIALLVTAVQQNGGLSLVEQALVRVRVRVRLRFRVRLGLRLGL